MKMRVLFLSFILFLSINGIAQLTFEGTIKSQNKIMRLDDGSLKYIGYNKISKEVSVYNLDNSLWRKIKLPLPAGHILDEIKHISVHTFNKDDLVELVYSCITYNSSDNLEDPEESFVSVDFTLNIISESGESILKIPDSSEMEIFQTNGHNKLLIYRHKGKHFSTLDETLIYSFL